MNFCEGKQDTTPRLSPCDGTANSSTWCCGETTDCCQTGNGVITLQQVFGRVSSSVSSSVTTATGTLTVGITTDGQSLSKLGTGGIASIVIGAVAGIALLAAAIFFACRKSRRKQAINVPPLFAENERGDA